MTKTKIEIIKGDLFSWEGHLAHGVNTAGAMGKGIAIQFKKRFPEMYQAYKADCNEGLFVPGLCWTWQENGEIFYNQQGSSIKRTRLIFNLAIKDHWRMPASYIATENSVKNLIKEMKENNVTTVAMPWIGCGLGGLRKEVVKKILEKALREEELVFRVYEL